MSSLSKIEWQKTIFAQRPQRLELVKLKTDWPCREITITVTRNAPFEFVQQAISPFLAYADLAAAVTIGDYDDSLPFHADARHADIEILWLDYERYHARMRTQELVTWLTARVKALRQLTTAPILLNNWPAEEGRSADLNACLSELERMVSGLRIIDLQGLQDDLESAFFDPRLKTIGASNFSGIANLHIARLMGLEIIPGVLRPRLKAIALDLDNTLYSGVLGEDGPNGLDLTPAHKALQAHIQTLHENGLFLAIISKNDPDDVERLFEMRQDFPLQKADFTALSVSWGAKSEGLKTIADKLRIGMDAILYLDDNSGELAEVHAAHPQVSFIYAANPEVSLSALKSFPNIRQWTVDATDSIRTRDLAAAEIRAQMQETASNPNSYLASLQTELAISVNNPNHLSRAHSLANKTNQFILSLSRYTEAEVADWITAPNQRIVTISMSDKLSDSGNIAAIFMKSSDASIEISELCVSCRALGRNIEDLIIISAIKHAYPGFIPKTVTFKHATGPRNEPGRNWLRLFTKHEEIDPHGIVSIAWPHTSQIEIENSPVSIQVV